MRRKAALFPGMYDLKPLADVWTVRGFDEAYTAPHHGFRDADDYYFRASALRVIDKIRVPALIIAAANDPFVPADQFRRPEVAGNPHVTVAITQTAAIARSSPKRRLATTATGPNSARIAFITQSRQVRALRQARTTRFGRAPAPRCPALSAESRRTRALSLHPRV